MHGAVMVNAVGRRPAAEVRSTDGVAESLVGRRPAADLEESPVGRLPARISMDKTLS